MERLLCVAGWSMHSNVFSGLAEMLRPDFDVAAVSVAELIQDDRCRETAQEPGAASLYARKISELVRAQQIPFVLGWSMGGVAVLEALAAMPAIRKVVLLSSTAVFARAPAEDDALSWAVSRAYLRAMARALYDDKERVLRRFYADACAADVHCAEIEALVRDGTKFSPGLLEHGLQYLRQADMRAVLCSISRPVLILHGDADRIVSPRAACYLNEHIPLSRMVMIREGGHVLLGTHRQEIAAEVRKFLRDE